MFAVELQFDDGVSPNEMIVVRRNAFVVGCSEDADVVVEGSAFSTPSVRIRRGTSGQFFSHRVGSPEPEKSFNGEGKITLGNVQLVIRPIDIDLILPPGESMDRAGLRVLRKSFSQGSPSSPSLIVRGDETFDISLPVNEAVLIGRSRTCALRLSSPSIQGEHALIRVWSNEYETLNMSIEPVGPDSDIILDGQRLSSPTALDFGSKFTLGRGAIEIEVAGSDTKAISISAPTPDEGVSRYPCLVSKTEIMRPDRYPLAIGRRVSVGRDPSNDIWLNSPHISRLHAEIILREDGKVEITDVSSNGTFYGGQRMTRDHPVTVPIGLSILDFSRGVNVGLCFNGKDEEEYFGEKRKPRRSSSLHGQILAQIQIPVTPFNSDEEQGERPSWFSESVNEALPGETSSQQWRGDRSGSKQYLSGSLEEPVAYSAPVEESVEADEYEELLPEKRMGIKGRLFFYFAVAFLLLIVYFQWAEFL